MDGRAVGAELRALRVLRGLTAVEAARRAGISRKSLQRWEAGEHAPRGEGLASLFATLEVGPQERASLLADAPLSQARPALADCPLGTLSHPGHMLRFFREFKELTQTQLAQAVGVSQAAVAKWEAGLAMPGEAALARAAAALGTDDLGLREGSLDLYDPIVSPEDARWRIRALDVGPREDLTLVQFMAIERELWPLAARDPRWELPLVEALSWLAYGQVCWGDLTSGLETAQRACRLAESADAWDGAYKAVRAVQVVREVRGADPARTLRLALDAAARAGDPFVRAEMLLRGRAAIRKADPRRADGLFHRAFDLIVGGTPKEFFGVPDRWGPHAEVDLDRLALLHALDRKDPNRAMDLFQRAYTLDFEARWVARPYNWDYLECYLRLHRLTGERVPEGTRSVLDAHARNETGYWSRRNLRHFNRGLGIYVPPEPVPR